jgi:hypothetical protein
MLIKRVVVLTLLAVPALGASLVPAAAAADSAATCSLDITLYLRPGLTLRPSQGTIASSDAGRLNCVGLIDGAVATGPGEFA